MKHCGHKLIIKSAVTHDICAWAPMKDFVLLEECLIRDTPSPWSASRWSLRKDRIQRNTSSWNSMELTFKYLSNISFDKRNLYHCCQAMELEDKKNIEVSHFNHVTAVGHRCIFKVLVMEYQLLSHYYTPFLTVKLLEKINPFFSFRSQVKSQGWAVVSTYYDSSADSENASSEQNSKLSLLSKQIFICMSFRNDV